MRYGLFGKFAAVMVALALVPAALLGFQLINISRAGIQAAVLELHTKLAEGLARSVDDYMRTTDDKVAFALVSLQKNMEWSEKQDLLRSLIETHRDIVEISMVDAKGRELVKVYNPDAAKDAALTSRFGEAAFKEFRKTGARASMSSTIDGTPALVTYYPLHGEIAARVLLSLRGLAARVAGERIGGSGFAVLVDKKGLPLFYDKDRLVSDEIAAMPRWPIVAAALQSHSVGSSEFQTAKGRAYVGAYAPLDSGGAIVTLQSLEDAYSAAIRMKRTAVAAMLFVVVLGLMAAIWQARGMARPLLELSLAAEAVSRGDFLATVKIETRDELQELAETFNRMTAQLRAYSVLQVDKLIAEQRKTEAILFSIKDGILLLDKDGKVQLANRGAFELLGLDPKVSLEGRALPDILPPDSKLTGAVVEAGGRPRPDAVKDIAIFNDETKKKRYFRVTGQPVQRPGSGAGIGVVVAVRDVTLERELDKMKEEFLHYITHDLRNPLGSAIGFLDMLLKGVPGVLNEEQRGIVDAVKRSNMRLLSMVNNILDIAKMESGRIRLQLKTVSITGIAGRSIATLQSQAKFKSINVLLDAAEEFSIAADNDLIERVFNNLLGNALKYTPNEGTVTISIRDDGDALKCCVADTGEGIPADYINRLFQKFEQVQGQRKGGTGLGLAIAKFFVESHLGRIWVESEMGKGSQFYFTIPKGLVADAEGAVRAGEPVA